MRRGYVDFTTEFAQAVDLVSMMPRMWRVIGALASPVPRVVRLVFENEHMSDGPPVRLDVQVHDNPLSRTIAMTMEDIDDEAVSRAIASMGDRLTKDELYSGPVMRDLAVKLLDYRRGDAPSYGPSDRSTITAPRFFLGHDDSGHRYAVPVERRAEWEAWAVGEDVLADAPAWAMRVEGDFTFTDPRDGD